MLEIPGYRWDEASKRYYKDDRRAPGLPAASAKQSEKNSSKKAAVATRKYETSLPNTNARKRIVRNDGSMPSFRLLDQISTQPINNKIQATLRERSLIATFASLQKGRVEQPNLSLGDDIICFEFDKDNPEILRYGTSAGLVGRGRFSDSPTPGHSTDQWEMEHIFGAPISSVHMDQGFFVSTSLGPRAQAVFGRTDSPSHVKFAPRQTSLWSSSIWRTQVALGCDKKVLYAHNPADQAFQSFGTGSAVFALELHQNELFVGTRSGHVRLFDVRQHARNDQASSPQILLRLQSPVTNIRLMTDRTFIIAQMDGSLARYDSRYLRQGAEPFTQYDGNVNTQTRMLGLDIWNEKVLAAVGEDGIVRSWIIPGGNPISKASSNAGSAPSADHSVRSYPMQFQPASPRVANLWVSDGLKFLEHTSK